MLPLHYSKFSVFNYDKIPAGYYYRAMTEGRAVQRFWHQKKFLEVAERIPANAKVLDFGCGPGSFLSVLGRRLTEGEAVGVDIASIQIEFAQREVKPLFPGSRVNFRQLEEKEERLPFADQTFDRITCIEVIEHIHPFVAMRIFQEMRRLLKPDGRILLTTPNYRSLWPLIEWSLDHFGPVSYHDQHINKFTPNSLIKFLETAGLKVESLQSIFMLSPFLAGFSWEVAERLYRLERSSSNIMGSLLVAEAKLLQMG